MMDEYRDALVRLEEVWFWPEISVSCGGWTELLVRATEESDELELLRKGEAKNNRSTWSIQRIGGVTDLVLPWPEEGESSLDYIPTEWEPEETVEPFVAESVRQAVHNTFPYSTTHTLKPKNDALKNVD